MYINLSEPKKEIKFGDIIKYDDEACVVVDGTEFISSNYPVLLVSLGRSKVINAFQNLEYLNQSSYKVFAEESSVEIVRREVTK